MCRNYSGCKSPCYRLTRDTFSSIKVRFGVRLMVGDNTDSIPLKEVNEDFLDFYKRKRFWKLHEANRGIHFRKCLH
jgi:hypothetical protein